MNHKAIQKRLDRKIEKSKMKIRQLEFKKMVERGNEPEYISHYSKDVKLGDERVFRIAYNEVKLKDGDKPVCSIDLRKFVLRKRAKKEGQDDYRPVWKSGVSINPQNWHDIFLQLVDLEMTLSEPEDFIEILKNIIQETMRKYPKEFEEGFYPTQQIDVAPQKKIVELKPSVNKKIEDTNFEKLGTIGKQKNIIVDDKKKWVLNNL